MPIIYCNCWLCNTIFFLFDPMGRGNAAHHHHRISLFGNPIVRKRRELHERRTSTVHPVSCTAPVLYYYGVSMQKTLEKNGTTCARALHSISAVKIALGPKRDMNLSERYPNVFLLL